MKLTSPFIAALEHCIPLADELLPSPPSRVAVGTHPSGHPSSRRGDQSNCLTSLELFPRLRSTTGEPLRWNTTAVVELYCCRLGSPPFHPLRSTPTITSPPAKPAQAPWSSQASSPSPPATTITGIWLAILDFLPR
jgi:hypothetical protein